MIVPARVPTVPLGVSGYGQLCSANAASTRGVIATNANFTRSDLGECDVTDADFTEAVIDRYQAIGLCETASGTNKFTGVDTRESLGCDYLKRYEGSGGAGKVAVTKGSGTWGGGK